MRAAVGSGRQRILDALFEEFGADGPSPDLSIRRVAEQIGVHHTLLTYHFGSRPGLLAAVLAAVRRDDNLQIAASFPSAGLVDLSRAVWDYYSDEAREERTRSFFSIVGLALYRRSAFEQFLAEIGDLTVLLEQAARRDGATPAEAATRSLLASSCLRGLLLQRLLDPESDVDAAAAKFFALLAGDAARG